MIQRSYIRENSIDLVEQVEIYRIAIACGIYSKTELSVFLDKIIVDLDEPPYEIIEASLACNKNMQDALHILKEYFYSNNGSKTNINAPVVDVLHLMKNQMETMIYVQFAFGKMIQYSCLNESELI